MNIGIKLSMRGCISFVRSVDAMVMLEENVLWR
jgi:hypothetical protein